MPFVLLLLGVLLIVVAIRNTYSQLGTLIVGDFTGIPNFFYWIGALFIIGALGYVDMLKAPSRMLLALVLIALLFSNQGFFAKFLQELQKGSASPPPPGPPPPSIGGNPVPSGAGQGGVGGLIPGIGGLFGKTSGGPLGGILNLL